MRIYLNCPYSEKEEAKSLGAKWNYESRSWYIDDPEDLKPFSKWMSDDVSGFFSKPATANRPQNVHQRSGKSWAKTGPTPLKPSCMCNVLPWDHCSHTLPKYNQL